MTKGKCRCSVPFCSRYIREEAGRWICPTHWRALPLKRRKAYQRAVMETHPEHLKDWKNKPRWLAPRPGRARYDPEGWGGERGALQRLYNRLEREAIRLAMARMM